MAEEGAATMQPYAVVFYEKANGSVPAEEFLKSLEAKTRSKFYRILGLLKEYGPGLREPYSKPLQDGIFELRIQGKADACRVLYFFCRKSTIVLTNGFLKKTRKMPRRHIERAKRYRNDFLDRAGVDDEDA